MGCWCNKTIKMAEDQRTLQEDLDSLITWEKQWSMDFRPQKCSTLSATRKRKKIIPAYELHGHIIENVSMTKYLGVTISSTTSKANKTLGFLRRNLKIGNKKTKKTAYKPLFARFLSTQPLYGIPTLQVRSRSLKTIGSRLSSRKNNTCSYDIPSCRAQYRHMSFFPRTIPDWNSLPQEVVTAESLDCCKFRLNLFL